MRKIIVLLSAFTLFAFNKDKKEVKANAEKLTFQKVSKPFINGGKFTTADILSGVQGNKRRYKIKGITALNPSNLVTVSKSKELIFNGGSGSFTATLVLERKHKINIIIENCAFEIHADQRLKVSNSGGISFKTSVNKSEVKTIYIPEILNGVVVKSIGSWAFYGCSSLKSITIQNSVTSIGDFAFKGCTSLKYITVPNWITSIGDSAFSGCTSSTSITIPNSVKSIEGWAFYGCTSLKSITIPNSVTSIKHMTFYGCTSLKSTAIPNSVTDIGSGAFGLCTSLKSITIPNSVTSIGEWAFYDCTSLTSITIPNSVTSIGNNAFYGWTASQIIRVPRDKRSAWLSKLKSSNSVKDSNIIGY